MTDDLFDDFDLKSSADSRKKEETGSEDILVQDSVEVAEFNSDTDMHPDIFPGEGVAISEDEQRHLSEKIEAEQMSANNAFSFSDDKKKDIEEKEEAFNYAFEEPAVEVRTIDRIRRSNVRVDPDNFGDTLRRLREAACISTYDLAEELRMKESFILALEREDYDNLPPEVFIIAYIRKLGGVYRLNEDEILLLTGKVRERMEVEIPEDIDKVVSVYEPSEENENKLRHIIGFFIVILVIAVLLVGVGIYFFVSSNKSDSVTEKMPQNKTEERFSSETLIKLQPEVRLQPIPLKITK